MELKNLKVAEMSRAEKQETKGGNPVLAIGVAVGVTVLCYNLYKYYVKPKFK